VYTATISSDQTTGARDAAGNVIATDFVWTFTTAAPVDNTAQLEWDSVSGANGYRVYYGTSPGTYFQPFAQGIVVGNATTYTVTGLSLGTTYYFAVTAVDAQNNESAFSNEVSKAIPFN
jgi:fibronectin type 3 domain-containing protein